jgi:hypothetical protein
MMNSRLNPLLTLALQFVASLLLVCALSGCAEGVRQPASTLANLDNSNEIVIVGRVELVPPLDKNEQTITNGFNLTNNFENYMLLVTDDSYKEVKGKFLLSDFPERIDALLENNFFVLGNSKPFFILGGAIALKNKPWVYFPGGFKVTPKPGDKAIYIGTIQYHRDEFFNVSKVTIVDDYESTRAQFNKKFGNQYVLQKSLMVKTAR